MFQNRILPIDLKTKQKLHDKFHILFNYIARGLELKADEYEIKHTLGMNERVLGEVILHTEHLYATIGGPCIIGYSDGMPCKFHWCENKNSPIGGFTQFIPIFKMFKEPDYVIKKFKETIALGKKAKSVKAQAEII